MLSIGDRFARYGKRVAVRLETGRQRKCELEVTSGLRN
jgi:hypothetical protein